MFRRTAIISFFLPTFLCLCALTFVAPVAARSVYAPSAQTYTATPTLTATATVTGTTTPTRTPTRTATPTPTRAEPFVAPLGQPVVFDFPTPRPLGAEGRLTSRNLASMSPLERSALAVVKLHGCQQAGAESCNVTDGSGVIIHPSGLILTALHVVLKDPDDLTTSAFLPEIDVHMVDDLDEPAESRYRATVAAYERELDLALLWITPPEDEPNLRLPALPVANADVDYRESPLRLMAFLQGDNTMAQPPVSYFREVQDRELHVSGAAGTGFSGGPLLVGDADPFQVGGIVYAQDDQLIYIRPVAQLEKLRWRDPQAPRLWADDARVALSSIGGLPWFKVNLSLHGVDVAEQEVRMLAQAFDPETDLPWPSEENQLILTLTAYPARFLDVVAVTLSSPLEDRKTLPEILRFDLQAWEVGQSRDPWVGNVSFLRPDETPTPTRTQTPTRALKTSTPTVTATPTTVMPDEATPTATNTRRPYVRRTSTPTRLPTATPTKISTFTPTPTKKVTPTRTSTPTVTPTNATIERALIRDVIEQEIAYGNARDLDGILSLLAPNVEIVSRNRTLNDPSDDLFFNGIAGATKFYSGFFDLDWKEYTLVNIEVEVDHSGATAYHHGVLSDGVLYKDLVTYKLKKLSGEWKITDLEVGTTEP